MLCSQGTAMSGPWIHSPDVKNQEFLLLQAALHNGVCVSLPAACETVSRSITACSGSPIQQPPPLPAQCHRRQGQRGQQWAGEQA